METYRNGNNQGGENRFVAYLWGMETSLSAVLGISSEDEFVAYLWGMETRTRVTTQNIHSLVCSLPMRNGNRKSRIQHHQYRKVCSLPMRNGNRRCPIWISSFVLLVCSLPMRNGNSSIDKTFISSFMVCSLPMRNGNSASHSTSTPSSSSFVAYLWGMETHFSHRLYVGSWVSL